MSSVAEPENQRRRLQLRLPAQLSAELGDCAQRSGISVVAFVRLLLENAMSSHPATASEAMRGPSDADDLPALAGLVATENVLSFLESIFPEGRSRAREGRAVALSYAEERLEELKRHLEDLR
ncbi:MAG: hypothetical protein ACR2MZ_14880 [Candidatus Dormibacter sp.]|uniref:hypothetical protein n=1 Tax=Candidatus Dormibacter sp. TaxID=2973982 RepID=UPI000DAF87A4|nr:MAG: hypothetical protein DLM66_07215 [Candidatus Dormibacteraeota bacterium]